LSFIYIHTHALRTLQPLNRNLQIGQQAILGQTVQVRRTMFNETGLSGNFIR